MANNKALKMLCDEQVEEFNRWAKQRRNKGKGGVDLDDKNLSGLKLHGIDLRGAHLNGCNLRKVDLKGADLRDARLRQADLRKAVLDEVDNQNAALAEAFAASLHAIACVGRQHGAALVVGDRRQARLAEVLRRELELDQSEHHPDAGGGEDCSHSQT